MKKLIACLVLMSSISAMAQITGSAHDFYTAPKPAWNGTTELCIACHTPHNALATGQALDGPLWNHAITATATFTLYTGTGTLNALDVGQPDGVSKLCLSCHDGSVALDSFGGNTVSPGTMITGTALVGTDLSNDHPVSFTYNTALATADGGLYDPATVTAVSDLLFSDKVECSSCHDVHNGGGFANLLVMANTGSALCLTCHNK